MFSLLLVLAIQTIYFLDAALTFILILNFFLLKYLQIGDVYEPGVFEKFPDLKDAWEEKIEIEVKAGQALYVPGCTWHNVRSYGRGMNSFFWQMVAHFSMLLGSEILLLCL